MALLVRSADRRAAVEPLVRSSALSARKLELGRNLDGLYAQQRIAGADRSEPQLCPPDRDDDACCDPGPAAARHRRRELSEPTLISNYFPSLGAPPRCLLFISPWTAG
jgi:hypothetical protein